MITVTALGLMAALAQSAPCESLRTISLPNTTITSAQLVAAGPYVAPAPGGPPGGPVVAAAAPAVVVAKPLADAATAPVAAAAGEVVVAVNPRRRRERTRSWHIAASQRL